MKRWIAVLAACACGGLCGGCIDFTTTVKVSRGGAGTVTEEAYVMRSMERVMGVFVDMTDAITAVTNAVAAEVEDERAAMLRRRAARMGRSVRFVRAEPVKRRDGASGLKAVYEFSDVRELRISPEPFYPFGRGAMTAASNDVVSAVGDCVTFGYRTGTPDVLAIASPWSQQAGASDAGDGPSPPWTVEEAAIARRILDGFRVRLLVTTDPFPQSSSAAYFEPLETRADQRAVVLYDINLGAIANSEDALKRIAQIGPLPDIAAAIRSYRTLPRMKVEMRPDVTVSF
jgi:hypothetical protein